VLITRRSKLYYTASGIVTPVGGHPVRRLREDVVTPAGNKEQTFAPHSSDQTKRVKQYHYRPGQALGV